VPPSAGVPDKKDVWDRTVVELLCGVPLFPALRVLGSREDVPGVLLASFLSSNSYTA
jgi:hypothetical protein